MKTSEARGTGKVYTAIDTVLAQKSTSPSSPIRVGFAQCAVQNRFLNELMENGCMSITIIRVAPVINPVANALENYSAEIAMLPWGSRRMIQIY